MPTKLVLYLQGTSPDPLFSVESYNEVHTTYRWFPRDYKLLDDIYCYAIISKTGIPSISYGETIENGKTQDNWDGIFQEFISWTVSTKK